VVRKEIKMFGNQDWGHRIISQNLFPVLKSRYERKFRVLTKTEIAIHTAYFSSFRLQRQW
jgi:hypothetical protein